jgi:hypothetical protein
VVLGLIAAVVVLGAGITAWAVSDSHGAVAGAPDSATITVAGYICLR